MKCKQHHYAMMVSFCLFVCLFAAAGAYRVDPCLLLWFIVAVDYGMPIYDTMMTSVFGVIALVNLAVRPERSSCLLSNVHLRGVVSHNLDGLLIRPCPSIIASLHDITDSFTSCYKSHRLQTRLRLLHYVVLLTRLQCRSKFSHYHRRICHWLSSRDVLI